jgi:RNA polymerase sigma factor (sigma-70 family)
MRDGCLGARFLDGEERRNLPSVVTSLSDARLVARCREGDQAAWAELVNRFSRYVYAIIGQGFSLRAQDAEDVFQEVFARTFQHLERLRDDEAIRPWIAQLTRRLCIDHIRARSREELTDEQVEPGELDETLATLEEALAVHEALAGLPEHCREILERFFARDESYQAIGSALDIPAGTIASRISRCLAKLREVFAGRKSGPEPS